MAKLLAFLIGCGAGAVAAWSLLRVPANAAGPAPVVRSEAAPAPPASAPASPAHVLSVPPSAPPSPDLPPLGAKASPEAPPSAAEPPVLVSDLDRLKSRGLLSPVSGVNLRSIKDSFEEMRGGHRHEAIDILAARGTPVVAVDDGTVSKLFTSKPGGLTVYLFDRKGEYCYYYAHLDRYAEGLQEGALLKRGETLGYVGTTGNAPKDTPHLHFTIFRLGPEKRWWEGVAVNPYPLWTPAR